MTTEPQKKPHTSTANNKGANNPFVENRWLILTIIFVILIYSLSPILTPFLIATVLAYICNPMVEKISFKGNKILRLSRSIASFLVILAITTAILILFLILVPLLQRQSLLLAERFPQFIIGLRTSLEPWLQSYFGINLEIDAGQMKEVVTKNWKTSGNILGQILSTAGNQGLAFVGILANLLLLPVVLFYLLRDWNILIEKIGELIPRKWIADVSKIAIEVDSVVAEFLRGQLSVMASLCIFYCVGLWLVGLDMALSIGLIAGLLSFVPYLGFALAFTMALILAAFQFTSLTQVIPVLLVFGVGQVLESFILTPYLVGERIGLHPLFVILALLAGGQLFGFVGVLLALPVSAALAVCLKHTKDSYLNSANYLK